MWHESSKSNYRIKIIGYCACDPDSLLDLFFTEGPESLTSLKGEYVVVIENETECCIVSSPYGVCQYYYIHDMTGFYHADTVLKVMKKAQIPWEWNWSAKNSLAAMKGSFAAGVS